jgi:hypothetical protein
VNPSGTIQSATTFATTGTKPYATETRTDASGNVYVAGSFDGTITINGVTQVNQGGNSNGFVAKYGYQCSTGIEDENILADQMSLQLYPNPANDELHLMMPTSVQLEKVEIYNTLGQLVGQKIDHDFSISELASGMHLLKITTSEGVIHKKFIKK